MTLFLLSYLAGALTILAPCILPVLPFVFARADLPFVRNGLPLLAGMALAFAAVGTLATVGGAWAAEANEAGRGIAIAVLAACGLALLVPSWAERWSRPLVALGARLSRAADESRSGAVAVAGSNAGAGTGAASGGGPGRSTPSVASSLLLGTATGLLWAPCAGPVLGLVLASAALNGASVDTTLLLLAYAAGAATSLAAALWAGGRALAAMKRSLGVTDWLRRGLGVAVLAGVATVALGLDTRLLAKLPPVGGDAIEHGLLDRFGPKPASAAVDMQLAAMRPVAMTAAAADAKPALPVEGPLPEFSGATGWLNSPPLTASSLRGKVVLVDIWTYGCINCQRAIPYVRGWAEKYKDQGLVTIGVHAPEFAFERKADNVKRAAADLGLTFPIALDNDFAIWRAFSNQYWPALYLVDAQGRIRYHHFGEGAYERSEQVIRQLLDEARGSAKGA